jgi:hypothetical protein
MLMVHASLRAIGPVVGGAEGVIEALHLAIEHDGTLLMILGAECDLDWINERPEAEREALLADAPPFDVVNAPVFTRWAISPRRSDSCRGHRSLTIPPAASPRAGALRTICSKTRRGTIITGRAPRSTAYAGRAGACCGLAPHPTPRPSCISPNISPTSRISGASPLLSLPGRRRPGDPRHRMSRRRARHRRLAGRRLFRHHPARILGDRKRQPWPRRPSGKRVDRRRRSGAFRGPMDDRAIPLI